MELRVNFQRLQADLEELATIGRREDHGLYRMAFSQGDMQARKWLCSKIKEAGLELEVDGAANIHGVLPTDEDGPSVVTGSHIDTVPGAGYLDGAYGVVSGLECLRTLKEQGVKHKLPIELISFSDEEGRFGGMLGSEALVGRVSPERLLSAQDAQGQRLVDVMREQGFDAMHVLRAARSPNSISAFVELHIEQGPVLDQQNLKVGVVEGIVGVRRWIARFVGNANHAGTTPMHLRQDAFMGVAELATALPRIIEEHGSNRSVITIGRVELAPGAANVVPGRAEFSLDIRDLDADILNALGLALRRTMSAIARRRELMFEFDAVSDLPPVSCDPGILDKIEASAEELGEVTLRLPSGAAHDTQQLATLTRVGMIFVPSKSGKSHSPAEWTGWDAIETGANMLLCTLRRLAN